MLVPTKRLWLLLGFGVIFAGVSAQAGFGWLMWAFDGVLLAVAILSARLAPSASELSVTREFDPVFSVRAANLVVIRFENSSQYVLKGRFRDEPDETFETSGNEQPILIGPDETKIYSYKTVPPERGTYEFRATFLRLICPLGLVEKQVRLETAQAIRVYPNLLALQEFAILSQRGKLRSLGVRKSRTRGLGSDFESLRDYLPGDDYRKMDWKATARRGKPIVKQFEVERNQSVVLVIDCGRHMLGEIEGVTKLDSALDSCLMLAKAAMTMGDQVGLLVFNDRVLRFVPPRKSNNQIGALIETIHDLVAEPVESDPTRALSYLSQRWKKRSLVVVFTDASDPEIAKSLSADLSALKNRHLVIVVQVNDPAIEVLACSIPQKKQDVYGQAAGLWLDDRRKEAIGRLKATHAHLVAAEPQELAKELVSAYFDIKEGALL